MESNSNSSLLEIAQAILDTPEKVLAVAYERAKSAPEILKQYGHAFFLAGNLTYQQDRDLRRANYFLSKSRELDPHCGYQSQRAGLEAALEKECAALPTPWDEPVSLRTYDDAQEIACHTERDADSFFRNTRRGEIRRPIIQFLLEYYKAGMRVLEMGCAAGGYYAALTRFLGKLEYVGIDISPAMIATAKRHFPGVDFRCGDASSLQFSADSFDIVLSIDVISFVRNWEQVLREAYRVSKKYFVMRVRTLIEDVMPTQVLTVGTTLLSYPYVIFNRNELAACLNGLRPVPAGHKIIRHIHDVSPTQDIMDLLKYRLPIIKRNDGLICVNDALDLAIMKY